MRLVILMIFSAASAFKRPLKKFKFQNETEVLRKLPKYKQDPNPISYLLKEPKITVTVQNDNDYKDRFYGRHWVANLIAGRTEFPWIVDLRMEDGKPKEPDLWATGNLVSLLHVFTTCRAIKLILREKPNEAEVDPTSRLSQITLTVSLCSAYLTEEYVRVNRRGQYAYQNSDDLEFGSRRLVKSIIYHSGCRYGDTLDDDAALITLQNGVAPQLPVIAYMPWIRDPLSNKPALFTEDYMRYEWQACYVGSFGKPYANYPDFVLKDYKVRFRAYYVSWFACQEKWHMICDRKNSQERICASGLTSSAQLICMETRSMVGTVCDHHRGSPIVCDDEVVGFVTRGAMPRYCSDVIPVPFIVMKLTAIDEWLDTMPKRLLTPVTTKRPKTYL